MNNILTKKAKLFLATLVTVSIAMIVLLLSFIPNFNVAMADENQDPSFSSFETFSNFGDKKITIDENLIEKKILPNHVVEFFDDYCPSVLIDIFSNVENLPPEHKINNTNMVYLFEYIRNFNVVLYFIKEYGYEELLIEGSYNKSLYKFLKLSKFYESEKIYNNFNTDNSKDIINGLEEYVQSRGYKFHERHFLFNEFYCWKNALKLGRPVMTTFIGHDNFLGMNFDYNYTQICYGYKKYETCNSFIMNKYDEMTEFNFNNNSCDKIKGISIDIHL